MNLNNYLILPKLICTRLKSLMTILTVESSIHYKNSELTHQIVSRRITHWVPFSYQLINIA